MKYLPTPPTNQPTPMTIDTPEKIQAYRLLTLKGMLKLETLGMTRNGKSAYSTIKQEFNLKGSKQAVFKAYVEILKSKGILV